MKSQKIRGFTTYREILAPTGHGSKRCRAINLVLTAFYLSLVILVAPGCVTGPDFSAPTPPILNETFSSQGYASYDLELLSSWWEIFNDPTLTELLLRAENNNLDLEQAFHRVMETRANVRIATQERVPNSGSISSYEYTKRSQNAQPFVGQNGVPFDLFTLGANANWELDFFGRIKRTIEAANAKNDLQKADYDNIRVTLLAEVATSYFRIRWIQDQIEITKSSLEIQETTTKLIEERTAAGLSTELDLTQTRAFVERTTASLPSLQRQLQTEFNQLSYLLGETLNQPMIDFIGYQPVPELPSLIGVGVPVNLLRSRPDIMRDEMALAAASARIGIAESELYPQFNLVGTIAVSAKSVSSLFETDSLDFSVGPSVRWNILNRRGILNNVEAHKARFNQAVAGYKRTVIGAVREVEDSLAQQQGYQQETVSLKRAVELDEQAVELGLQRYKVGKANFQRVLDVQQQLLNDQQAEVNSRVQSLVQMVHVYKAVGGGWAPINQNFATVIPANCDWISNDNGLAPNPSGAVSNDPSWRVDERIIEEYVDPTHPINLNNIDSYELNLDDFEPTEATEKTPPTPKSGETKRLKSIQPERQKSPRSKPSPTQPTKNPETVKSADGFGQAYNEFARYWPAVGIPTQD